MRSLLICVLFILIQNINAQDFISNVQYRPLSITNSNRVKNEFKFQTKFKIHTINRYQTYNPIYSFDKRPNFDIILGRKKRGTGITVTCLGLVMMTGGILLMSSAQYSTYSNAYGASVRSSDPRAFVGTFIVLGSIPITIVGIVNWSKGSRILRRAKEAEKSKK